MPQAEQSPLAVLLKHAVDLIDGGAVIEKSPREVAFELTAEGQDPNVRIGLNYLRGRMQNLEDELLSVRKAYTELDVAKREAQREARNAQYQYERLNNNLPYLKARVEALEVEVASLDEES